jgi:hypothetical protein
MKSITPCGPLWYIAAIQMASLPKFLLIILYTGKSSHIKIEYLLYCSSHKIVLILSQRACIQN